MTQSSRPQNAYLVPFPALPAGLVCTPATRFTLPAELAEKLKAMPKAQRDELMRAALLQLP